MIVAPDLQQIVFGGLVAGALGLELLVRVCRKPGIQSWTLAAALSCFGVGAALWALNRALLPCNPLQPVQWHAIWHLLAAVAAGFLYAYYLSERNGNLTKHTVSSSQ